MCVNINTNINRSIDGSIYLCILYYIIISYLTIYLPILSYLLFSCLVLSYLILSFFLYIYLIVSYLNLSYYPTIYLSTYLSTYLLITGTALPSRCLRFFSRIVHHVTIFLGLASQRVPTPGRERDSRKPSCWFMKMPISCCHTWINSFLAGTLMR